MLEFTYYHCQLCSDTNFHLFDYGTITFYDGKEQTLNRICKICYGAIMDDFIAERETCPSCGTGEFTVKRKYYSVKNCITKKPVRIYKEFLSCGTCSTIVYAAPQKQMENYRTKLAISHPTPELIMWG